MLSISTTGFYALSVDSGPSAKALGPLFQSLADRSLVAEMCCLRREPKGEAKAT